MQQNTLNGVHWNVSHQSPAKVCPGTESELNLLLLNFQLPSQLEAGEPPEARGLARDQVKLMISDSVTDKFIHTQFRQLPDFLSRVICW